MAEHMPQILPHPLVRVWVCGSVVELWFCLWETLHLATVVHTKKKVNLLKCLAQNLPQNSVPSGYYYYHCYCLHVSALVQ